MNNLAFELLFGSIGAAAFWVLWFYFIKEYRVDAFRERLFAIRDELFLFAADGNVPFDSPAYVELRSLINAMLRFAHRFTFLTLLTSVKSSPSDMARSHPYLQWRESLDTLEPKAKEQIERIHNALVSTYMNQLVEGSIILLPFAAVLFLGFLARAHLKRFFSPQETEGLDARTVMLRDLARTLNVERLEAEAYKAKDRELSLA